MWQWRFENTNLLWLSAMEKGHFLFLKLTALLPSVLLRSWSRRYVNRWLWTVETVTVERSERHREGPSGPIRAERYPTVKLDLKHKKTIFALWASQTWRTAQSNHNHSRFTYNNTAHRHNTSVKCGHLILKGDPFKILELPFFLLHQGKDTNLRQWKILVCLSATSHKNCQNLAYINHIYLKSK